MIKRRLLSGLFAFCGLISAQTLTTTVVPTGPWPLCEPKGIFAASLGNPFCAGFVPGVSETYFLLIGGAADNPKIVGWRYLVTATVGDQTITSAGVVSRWDSKTGWPAPNVSMIIMSFGGIADNFNVIELQPIVTQ